jgi:Icc-related predicted phosphoesterase
MPFGKRRKGSGEEPTRIFYASDIHGSQITFRKFLNSAKFYGVDALVFGGDLMGKLLVPIVRDVGGTWRASLQGQQRHLKSPEQLAAFTKNLETLGFYWY